MTTAEQQQQQLHLSEDQQDQLGTAIRNKAFDPKEMTFRYAKMGGKCYNFELFRSWTDYKLWYLRQAVEESSTAI